MDDKSATEVLRREFAGEEGSFLFTLRMEFMWDRDAFSLLTEAMRLSCELHGDIPVLERWLAEGFWFLATFVQGHSQHPDFRLVYEPAYYAQAYERLWALADWFFRGYSPYMTGTGFEPL